MQMHISCDGCVECRDGTETGETKLDVEREGIRVRGARHWRWFREESTNGGSDRKEVLSARDQTCTNKDRKSKNNRKDIQNERATRSTNVDRREIVHR